MAHWRRLLRPGSELDARDYEGRWYEAVVVARGPASELCAPATAGPECATGPSSSVLGPSKKQARAARRALKAAAGGEAIVVHFKGWAGRYDEVKHLDLDGWGLSLIDL